MPLNPIRCTCGHHVYSYQVETYQNSFTKSVRVSFDCPNCRQFKSIVIGQNDYRFAELWQAGGGQ